MIEALDLDDVTLVCQDWGGPTGLAQAATAPERFSRLVVMNTWLHHPGYVYSDGARDWISMWLPGGVFDRERPNVACVPALLRRARSMDELLTAIVSGTEPLLDGAAARNYAGLAAPFRDLPDEAFNGARRFPRCIPLNDPNAGD